MTDKPTAKGPCQEGQGMLELRHPDSGKLMCKYDPQSNRIQIKSRGQMVWISLDVLTGMADKGLLG